jgi:hypothetical protein
LDKELLTELGREMMIWRTRPEGFRTVPMRPGLPPRASARRSVTAAALVVALAWGSSAAQDKAPSADDAGSAARAFVNSVSFQPLPDRPVISVRPLDNSEANLKLKSAIEEGLRARGFGVTKDSPLVLSFDTRDEVGAWTDSGRRTILELRAEGGRDGGEYAHAKVNVFDSTSGGLLNEGRGGTSIATPSTYRIDATLDDRTSGRRVWQGWAVANLSYGERTDLDRAMIPAIVENLGRTTTRKPFDLK